MAGGEGLRVLAALLRLGWAVKREAGSHSDSRICERTGARGWLGGIGGASRAPNPNLTLLLPAERSDMNDDMTGKMTRNMTCTMASGALAEAAYDCSSCTLSVEPRPC